MTIEVGEQAEGWVYLENRRLEMLPYIPATTRRLLDVGCGKGTFAREVKRVLGGEVWGIELDPIAAAIAREHLDHVEIGDVDQCIASIPSGAFDCVVFNDILEHLLHPDRTLRGVARVLAPHGVVVASIPNVRYIGNLYELLIKRDWEYKSSGILDRTHLRFYTRKSLPRLFAAADYELQRVEGINGTTRWLFPLFVWATLGLFADAKYLQFACVARPKQPAG